MDDDFKIRSYQTTFTAYFVVKFGNTWNLKSTLL